MGKSIGKHNTGAEVLRERSLASIRENQPGQGSGRNFATSLHAAALTGVTKFLQQEG